MRDSDRGRCLGIKFAINAFFLSYTNLYFVYNKKNGALTVGSKRRNVM